MWETTWDGLFHWRKSYYGLWTRIWVKNILMLDLSQLLSSPDVNWWTGVVWIIVMFLSDSHSDGTHSLQRHWCSDAFLQTWWRNKLILILDGLRVSTFTAHFHFWVNYSFKEWLSVELLFLLLRNCWLINLKKIYTFWSPFQPHSSEEKLAHDTDLNTAFVLCCRFFTKSVQQMLL